MAKYHIGQKIYGVKNKVAIDENDNFIENVNILPVKNVIKLGITTMPGVNFIFNNAEEISNNKEATIEIGRTGFFELDLKGLGMTINSISVADKNGAKLINNNYCYIDYIYEDGGSGV